MSEMETQAVEDEVLSATKEVYGHTFAHIPAKQVSVVPADPEHWQSTEGWVVVYPPSLGFLMWRVFRINGNELRCDHFSGDDTEARAFAVACTYIESQRR
jgi:hypothetical protein